MAIVAAQSAPSKMSNTRLRPTAANFLSGQKADQNNKSNVSPAAPEKKNQGQSFFYGIYADAVKTLWKILSGAMLTEVVRGVLKTNKEFSLAKIIDKAFRVDFISRFVADFGGALTVRLFSGNAKILGWTIPKIHTALSSQVFTNLWVKFWRAMSSSDNLNKLAADTDNDPRAQKAIKRLESLGWMKGLKKMDKIYKEKLSPALSWIFGTIFGIKGGSKDAVTGKETKPSVRWAQFGAVAAASGILTSLLPRDTQIYGFEDVHKSKNLKETLWNSVVTWCLTSVARLENYIFNNAVTLQPKGYGYDACKKVAVREKGFIPMAQYACDNVAAVLSKSLPINGAFLSSMLRLPIEIATTFMTASLIGISKENRVKDHWIYLADKIMKPLARVVETVVTPIFWVIKNVIYRPIFGFFPAELDKEAKPYDEKRTALPKDREDALFKRLGHKSTLRLLLKSVFVDIWTKDLWVALRESLNTGKNTTAKANKK